jgi:hypothetical protein
LSIAKKCNTVSEIIRKLEAVIRSRARRIHELGKRKQRLFEETRNVTLLKFRTEKERIWEARQE